MFAALFLMRASARVSIVSGRAALHDR